MAQKTIETNQSVADFIEKFADSEQKKKDYITVAPSSYPTNHHLHAVS